MSNRPTTGFSLIELLVTVALVGILASLAYPSFRGQMARATMIEARLALASLAAKQAQNQLQHGRFMPLTAVLVSEPLSARLQKAFRVSQDLSDDAQRFQLTLTPSSEGGDLRVLSMDHSGQLHSNYSW